MEKTPKLIIYVNPSSGIGQGEKISQILLDYLHEIFPNMVTGHFISSYNKEFQLLIRDKDLRCFDGIIGVGGDGTMSEIVNGILANRSLPSNLKIGHIPAGTGNGLIKSIMWEQGKKDIDLKSTMNIIGNSLKKNDGLEKTLDIFRVINKRAEYFSFLAISFGFISDLDIESERCRCLGSPRFILGAINNILQHRSYFGEMYYIDQNSNSSLPDLNNSVVPDNCTIHKISGNFIFFWACNTSHASSDTFSSPNSKMNDGFMHISIILEGISRWRLYKIISQLENGKYIEDPLVKVVKTKEFRLYPDPKSKICIDGELIESIPFQCQYFSSLPVFS